MAASAAVRASTVASAAKPQLGSGHASRVTVRPRDAGRPVRTAVPVQGPAGRRAVVARPIADLSHRPAEHVGVAGRPLRTARIAQAAARTAEDGLTDVTRSRPQASESAAACRATRSGGAGRIAAGGIAARLIQSATGGFAASATNERETGRCQGRSQARHAAQTEQEPRRSKRPDFGQKRRSGTEKGANPPTEMSAGQPRESPSDLFTKRDAGGQLVKVRTNSGHSVGVGRLSGPGAVCRLS